MVMYSYLIRNIIILHNFITCVLTLMLWRLIWLSLPKLINTQFYGLHYTFNVLIFLFIDLNVVLCYFMNQEGLYLSILCIKQKWLFVCNILADPAKYQSDFVKWFRMFKMLLLSLDGIQCCMIFLVINEFLWSFVFFSIWIHRMCSRHLIFFITCHQM